MKNHNKNQYFGGIFNTDSVLTPGLLHTYFNPITVHLSIVKGYRHVWDMVTLDEC